MTEEADARILIGETGSSVQLVEDVTPALRRVERRMNDGKAGHQPQILQIAQPFPVLLVQLLARPDDGLRRERIEPFHAALVRAQFVMIALHAWHPHFADNIQALLWVCAVTYDVPQARIM